MEQFVGTLRDNPELQAVLKNPIMKQDKKRSILDALFENKIHPSIVAFFHIMVRKGRAGILYATAREFIREYNEVKGIVHATVVSATKLSETNLDGLQKVIASEINAGVILRNTVDPSLIGGFVVNVGDKPVEVGRKSGRERMGQYV